MKVRFTRPALMDIAEIEAWIARDSPAAAIQMLTDCWRRATTWINPMAAIVCCTETRGFAWWTATSSFTAFAMRSRFFG